MAVDVGTPLLETKLRPPERRAGVVPRPGLTDRLEQGAQGRLTLVTAPAGWGKTTVVGDWLAGRSGAAGWVALDPADNDSARFWRYVAEALRRAGARLDDQSVGALGASDDTFEAGLSALLNAAAELPEPAVLALDDYHLISHPAVHRSVEFLLSHLPERLRLVMASRSEPPIGVPRLRARGELTELRASDLRFDDGEAAALLGGVMGHDLEDAEVVALCLRTEGWAAGLYLAGLSMRDRADAPAFIDAFAGDDRLVVDYLAAEVLDHQPPERREFLLRTSILGRLTGPLCDAVAGTVDAGRTLAELERSNLFLVPLDSRREWYRYHHLFGELLQHELALSAPGELPDLHRRAAGWYLDNGSVDEAIHHRAAAGDLGGAADLIAEHWTDTMSRGYTGTIERWLASLPQGLVDGDARLCLAGAWIGINLGRPDDAAAWIGAVEWALGGQEIDPGLAASLAAARSLERLLAGDAGQAAELGLVARSLPSRPGSWERAVASLALGIALHGSGELDEAAPVLEEAVDAGRRSRAWAPALVALCHLADHDLRRGDVDTAEQRAREALRFAEEERHAEFPHAAGGHTVLAQVLVARGDLDEAWREAVRGSELARRGRAPTEIAHSVLAQGEVALARNDIEAATAGARDARILLGSAPDPGQLADRLLALEEALPRSSPSPAGGEGELSSRELAVLRRMAGLESAREIAAALYVSHNTIKTQIRSIYRKLGVATRAEAVARARERGLLSRSPPRPGLG
jgi:LuxR family maltose regulon positive regulatory protein